MATTEICWVTTWTERETFYFNFHRTFQCCITWFDIEIYPQTPPVNLHLAITAQMSAIWERFKTSIVAKYLIQLAVEDQSKYNHLLLYLEREREYLDWVRVLICVSSFLSPLIPITIRELFYIISIISSLDCGAMSGFKEINDGSCGSNFVHIQMKENFYLNKQINGVDEIRKMRLIFMNVGRKKSYPYQKANHTPRLRRLDW